MSTPAAGRDESTATSAHSATESPQTESAEARSAQAKPSPDKPTHTVPKHAAHEEPDEQPKKKQPPVAALIGIVSVVIGLMLLAFAAPAVHSGADNLPLAVSGPAPAVEKVKAQLDQAKPGAFDVKTYATAEEGAQAIKNRDVIGGIAVTAKGMQIQTASAAGTPYAQLLKGIGAGMQAKGAKVTYTDVVPLPKKDPLGTTMTSIGLPMIFGGMASAAILTFLYHGNVWRKLLAAACIAFVGGLIVSAILKYWLDVIDANYFLLAGSVALGIAAISFFVLAFVRVLGPAGMGIGAVVMLFISNPLSGLATGWQWLPKPWGSIGQYLPVGAAGTELRSVAYFDGAGATHARVVLAFWVIGGIVIAALGHRYHSKKEAAAAAA